MRRLFVLATWWLILLAAVSTPSSAVAADDPESLRTELLKLNETVGETLLAARIEKLKQNPAAARPLVSFGAKLAKDSDSQLNFTSAFILGNVARELKDVDSGKALFQFCATKAERIKSERKLALAYLANLALHLENQQVPAASAIAIDYLKLNPNPDEIDDLSLESDEALSSLLGELVKQKEGSIAVIKAAVEFINKDKRQPVNLAALYLLASLARQLDEFDSSKAMLRLSIDRCQEAIDKRIAKLRSEGRFQSEDLVEGLGKLATLHVDYIDLLFDNKKYEEAEKAAKEVLELPYGSYVAVAKVHALLRGIQATALQGKIEEATKQLQPYLKKFPDDPDIMRLNGWLLIQAGKNEEATKAYENLLAKATTDEAREKYRYLLSGLYTEIGEVEKAIQHLRILLQKNPDHPTYNNDLGFMLADHDMDLDEAERLVRKALDKEPKRSSFQDSLGWVLYKKGKYKEAKEYLQLAVRDKEGQHSEIYDHLGDVHLALGEKADAVSAYKKALQVAGSTPRELKRKAEIEKKLKELQQP